MNILYVHGLGGGMESNTGQFIRKYCPYDNVYTPDIPFSPHEAKKFILKFCEDKKIDLVVGHSLGGFYSMIINDINKILINPAMKASKDISNAIGLGTYEYHSRRENGDKIFVIDQDFINKLKELEDDFYYSANKQTDKITYGVFSMQDELFSYVKDYKVLYKNEPVLLNGLHSLKEEEFVEYVLPSIKNFRRKYFLLKYGKDIYKNTKCLNMYESIPEDIMKFRLSEDKKEYYLEGIYNVPLSNVLIIPSKHNDLPVTKITKRAFVYCYYYNCGYITKIFIPSAIREIDDESFVNIRSLKEIEVDKDNKYFYLNNNCLIRNSDNKTILKPVLS